MGLFLAVWSVAAKDAGPPSGGQKVLDTHRHVAAILKALQIVALYNGIVLFASGIGIQRRVPWGYPLARLAATTMILNGVAFLVGFQYLGKFHTLEENVG
jgi:hypothetical protein